ncbi:MAG: PaaI family thioesterase [Dehalococcoidia bacterium]|nr:PaaI family thioesterase [Dehalococcoidia bacterium]
MQEPEDSPRHWCYGCGDRNPEGLHIQFEVEGGRVTGRFTARQAHQGYPGLAHGGIAAAVLDEAMGWAMYAAGAWAMTARMEVKYRRPLPLGRPLTVTAEVLRERGRRLEAQAAIHTASGRLLAEAQGLFLRVPLPGKGGELDRFFLGEAAPR